MVNTRRKLLNAAVGVGAVSYATGCQGLDQGQISGNLVSPPPTAEFCYGYDAAPPPVESDAGQGDAGETATDASSSPPTESEFLQELREVVCGDSGEQR